MKISREIPSRTTIDIFEYLLYLLEQQILIYRICKYYLHPNGVENHLQWKYLVISLKICKELMSYIEGLMLQSSSKVITSITIISVFECLEIIQGFCCLACNCLCGTPRSIQEHCRDHIWLKPEDMSCNPIDCLMN